MQRLAARAWRDRALRSQLALVGPVLALIGLLSAGFGLVVASAPIARGQDVARKPFTPDEKARLAAGKLVTRPVTEKRGDLRLIGGASWQVIKAPPEIVFRALLDTKNYPHSLPTVSAASVVSDGKPLRRVRLEHKKGPVGIAYRLALTIDPQRRDVGFKLNDRLESGMRAAWGFLAATPYGEDQTLLSYGVMADPGDGLIVGIVRGVIHDWLLKVPEQVKKHVESPYGRRLYPLPPAQKLQAGSGATNAAAPPSAHDAGQPRGTTRP
jgi:ribosome-associated toxin RatA of RatAB toxin-antitoxin module